jgi:hypothetical protein
MDNMHNVVRAVGKGGCACVLASVAKKKPGSPSAWQRPWPWPGLCAVKAQGEWGRVWWTRACAFRSSKQAYHRRQVQWQGASCMCGCACVNLNCHVAPFGHDVDAACYCYFSFHPEFPARPTKIALQQKPRPV